MQFNCKHSVALLLQARQQTRQPLQRRPHWELVFEQAFPDAGEHATPLALAVAFNPDHTGADAGGYLWATDTGGVLQMRPLRPGKRKPWVNTGATWTDVRNRSIDGADPAQMDALDALRRITAAADPWSLGEPAWVSVDRTDNPGLWPVLTEVVRAGITFIPEGVSSVDGLTAVTLQEEPGRVFVRIDEADDGDVHVSADAAHPQAPAGADIHLIGTPAHGMAWTDGPRLHLAPLERAANNSWTTLRREGLVRVPAQDRPRFEREVLPRVLREPWSSPTGRYIPPQPPVPQLHLEVRFRTGDSAVPRAILAWSFTYSDDHGEEYGPLDLAPRPGDPRRDPVAENEWHQVAADALAPLGNVAVDSGTLRPRALVHGMAVVTLVTDVLPALEQAGVVVAAADVPAFSDAGPPQVQVEVAEADRDWFDLQLTMTVAGQDVPIGHVITALTRGEEALFLPDGSFMRLEDPELEQLRQLLAESYEMTDQRRQQLRVPRVQISWWEELLGLGVVTAAEHQWLQALQSALHNPPAPPPVPAGLTASLRPYQVAGYQWLAALRRSGLGGILADDMGLGKTLQVLAMILDERTGHRAGGVRALTKGEPQGGSPGGSNGGSSGGSNGGLPGGSPSDLSGGSPSGSNAEVGAPADAAGPPVNTADSPAGPWLVVAPTSVVPNWAAEAARFTPDLRVAVVTATGARRGQSLAEAARGADVVVTSYALLRLEAEE
ncbi:MAG TPA: SNF2-related protein, partial [Beutenbergiaceae bacterium]|nr:SNF2-related protein [Beutenbergiaceae bacterium]